MKNRFHLIIFVLVVSLLVIAVGDARAQAPAIGDLVFRDLNNNGQFEPGLGETGIGGVVVNLYRDAWFGDGLNSFDELIATTTTDGGGFYRFEGLAPGDYLVEIALSNFDLGQPLFLMASSVLGAQGYDPNSDVDDDNNGYHAGSPFGVAANALSLGIGTEPTSEDGDPNTNLTVDFGFRTVQAPAIGDLVWRDLNNNGVRDQGEPGIDGVVVHLHADAFFGDGLGILDPVIATTTTGGGGFYRFEGLAPGNYLVEVALSNFDPGQPLYLMASSALGAQGYDPNSDVDDDNNGYHLNNGLGPASNGIQLAVGLEPTSEDGDPNTNLTVDFGFRTVQAPAIGDLVFRDLNDNGQFEPELGETGIDGVVMNLYRDAWYGDGLNSYDELIATTTTSGGGLYRFDNLAPGNYLVEVALVNFGVGQVLGNWVSSSPVSWGPDDGVDNDNNGYYAGGPFGVAANALNLGIGIEPTSEDGDPNTNLTVDFGFREGQFPGSGPVLLYANAICSSGAISVRFDKALDNASALTAGNYSLSGGLSVVPVGLQPDQQGVYLASSEPFTQGVTYTLTVNNVLDLLGRPIAPDSQVSLMCYGGTTPDDLGTSPPCFVIEAEDYDHGGGQTVPAASVMPYTGGAFDGLAPALNVDYYNNDANDSDLYRPDTAPNNVDMNDNLGGRWGARRPGYDVVVNYKIGWVAEGEWQNYTRDIPKGTYAAWAALSFDGTADHQLRGRLSKVTSGVGTEVQTLEDLGTFDAPGSGGWGANDLVPMKGSDGTPAAFAHPGGPVTLRFWLGSGDFDWFALKPVLDFAGFLPPIGGADATGSNFADPLRSFKLKSTIPVKFTASCDGAPVLTGIHTLEAIKWSSHTDSESPIDATPTDAATTGNQFRLTGSEWHFNLDTRATGMSVGKWQLIATLSDGSQHGVWIQLK